MISLKENPAAKKIEFEGEEIIIDPQYVMKVSHLRKEFNIRAEDNSYYCYDEMTFIQASSLSPMEMPDNLSITFKSHNIILDVYDIYMISKKNKTVVVGYCFDKVGLKSFK